MIYLAVTAGSGRGGLCAGHGLTSKLCVGRAWLASPKATHDLELSRPSAPVKCKFPRYCIKGIDVEIGVPIVHAVGVIAGREGVMYLQRFGQCLMLHLFTNRATSCPSSITAIA